MEAPPMALERRRKKEERMPSYVRTYVGRGTTWVMLYKSWQHTRKRSPPSLLSFPLSTFIRAYLLPPPL